jgi:hypothetical protein
MTFATPSQHKPFRILSLDGGGIRGAFTAALLADIEERLGCRACDYFDLIAGTSTGGIIAAAIAAGEPASRIVEFYRERGPAIFTRRKRSKNLFSVACGWVADGCLRRHGIDSDWLLLPKYDATALTESLEEVFGNRTMEDLRFSRTVIPSVDLTKGQTVVFKTPHLPGLVRDRRYRIVDVILATTAAPTYFPHATLGIGSAYVDGGVWANNPTMVALAESIRIGKECLRPAIDPLVVLESVHILSIGTGKAGYFARPPECGGGIAWWLAGPLIDLVGVSQSQGVHFQAQYVLNDHYQRIDFDVPNGGWKLDCVDLVDHLIHIGRSKAAEHFSSLNSAFFNERTQPYVAYDSPRPCITAELHA